MESWYFNAFIKYTKTILLINNYIVFHLYNHINRTYYPFAPKRDIIFFKKAPNLLLYNDNVFLP